MYICTYMHIFIRVGRIEITSCTPRWIFLNGFWTLVYGGFWKIHRGVP